MTPVPSIGINSSNGRPGRPELDASEKARRLAFGQRAEEIKVACPEMTWKEIYVQLGTPFGEGASGLKKLEYARAQLRRLQEHDPEGLLEQMRLYREKHGMQKALFLSTLVC